jgi:hypothetical protein
MLRRPPTRRETTWSVLGLVLFVLVSAYAVLYLLDWQVAPVHSGLAAGLMAVGILTDIPFLRATRSDPPANLGLVDVERSARWPLRRELWAGRPGPVELRRYAVGWATRCMNRPSAGSAYIWLAGWFLANGPGTRGFFPTGVLDWVYCAVLAALVIPGVGAFIRRRRAEQVIEALEREAAADRDDEVTAGR